MRYNLIAFINQVEHFIEQADREIWQTVFHGNVIVSPDPEG